MSKKTNINSTSEFFMGLSFEEKSVWIQLLGVGVTFMIYMGNALKMMEAGITELSAYLPVFGISIGFLITFLVIGHILVSGVNPKEAGESDERDRLIDWKGESRASYFVGVGVLTALAGLFAGWPPVIIAHILLHTLFVGELAKLGFQLFYYRKGI